MSSISRKTQKDVGKYQAKLIGPFTVRQSIYVGIASIITIILWNILDAFQIAMEEKVVTIIIMAAPVALLGFLNPYGNTCLEFLKQYYEYHILSSKKRIFQTVTDDERLRTQQQSGDNKGAKGKQQKKQNVTVKHKKLDDFPEYY